MSSPIAGDCQGQQQDGMRSYQIQQVFRRLSASLICHSAKVSHVQWQTSSSFSLEKQASTGDTIVLRNSPETCKQVWLVLHTLLVGKAPSGDKGEALMSFTRPDKLLHLLPVSRTVLLMSVAASNLGTSIWVISHQKQHLSHPFRFTKHAMFWCYLHALHWGYCFPSHQRNPLSFEASTITHTEEENKAPSTLASLLQ